MNCYDTCLMGIGVIFLFRNCLKLQNTLRTFCHWELVILQQMTVNRYSYFSNLNYTTLVFTTLTVQAASSEFKWPHCTLVNTMIM